MGNLALLAALLVASACAYRIPDTSGTKHGDEVAFQVDGQQVIGQFRSNENGQFQGERLAQTHEPVDLPPQHEWEPPFVDPLKLGGPWHPGPKFTNLTIYEALSTDEDYSKLVKLINYDEDYVSFLNDTSHNVTFFAPNNHALTFPKHKRGRKHPDGPDDGLAALYEQFESLTTNSVDGDGDDDDEKKKKIKLILHAILQYHTLPERVIRPVLHVNTTYPTLLIAKDGSFGGQARRIGVESHGIVPFGPLKINFYAFVLPKEWYTANGVVYTISRPLLPPPSVLDELFLGRRFFVLTSALQKVGLDDWLSWEWKKRQHGLTEKGATVTFFAPSDHAFNRLPPKLRRFLFSPFGAKALKKILSYHIVPDIILHTDFFYNATETEDELREVLQWHEEELHDTAALAFGHALLGMRCKSHRTASHEVTNGFEHIFSDFRPRFGLPTAGRLPRQKYGCKGPLPGRGRGPSGFPGEEKPTPGSPEHEPRPGPPNDRKWPDWPIPKIPHFPPPLTFNYSLPTVLEDGVLNVTITKPLPPSHHPLGEDLPDPEVRWVVEGMEEDPPGAPPEHKPPFFPPLLKSSIAVNGQLTRLEAVARNGAVHSIGRLLNPFKGKKPEHGPPTEPKEGEDDEWADWEEWLPAWAEL